MPPYQQERCRGPCSGDASLHLLLNEGSPPRDWLWGHLLSSPLCLLDKNECYSQPCKNGGTCLDLDGDYACKCPSPFLGKTCHVRKSLAPTVQKSLSSLFSTALFLITSMPRRDLTSWFRGSGGQPWVAVCWLPLVPASLVLMEGASLGRCHLLSQGAPEQPFPPSDLRAVRGTDGWCGFG